MVSFTENVINQTHSTSDVSCTKHGGYNPNHTQEYHIQFLLSRHVKSNTVSMSQNL
jgi:hypothetical protein